jgi:hypothetical protein
MGDVPDVIVEQCIDLAAGLQGRIAQRFVTRRRSFTSTSPFGTSRAHPYGGSVDPAFRERAALRVERTLRAFPSVAPLL